MAERRRGGLARLPDFGPSAEDRLLGSPAAHDSAPNKSAPHESAPDGSTHDQQPARRRPLKVDESLADQVRDAVLYMRGRGRPELTQNELLDELITQGLRWLQDETNGGQQFPAMGRRPTGRRPSNTR